MRTERLVLGGLATNCWVVAAEEAGAPVIVIDPADDAEAVLAVVGERKVVAVVLTHGHFDHLGAVGEVVSHTGAPLMIHTADAAAISDPARNGARFFGFDVAALVPDRFLEDGDEVRAGAMTLEVLHTPGHTPGCISLYAEGHLFSGDTVFAGSVGRTDLPGGNARDLRRSIERRIVPLPGDTAIHPGHGPDTTVDRERVSNPFFPRG